MDNTKKLKKGHKDVQNLGVIADTILLIEIADALERRLKEFESGEPVLHFFSPSQVKTVLNTYLDVINPERQRMYAD